MFIGSQFKQIRKHFGLSQAHFAQMFHRTPGFICNVENGLSEASPATIRRICTVFGINEEWLNTGSGEMFVEGRGTAEANKENVCSRIRLVRKREQLTQEQFAKAIGYSKMQVHYAEIGKVTPSSEFIGCVASKFEVSYDWLITGKGKMEKEEAVVDEKLIEWLKRNPEVVSELKRRSGLD